MNPRRIVAVATLLLAVTGLTAGAQVLPGPAFDECGVLVRGVECVLFEGGGGRYVLSDYGDFKVGDAVRVVGTLNENCISICSDADGCIAEAVVYDPVALPCGTEIPSISLDTCATTAAGLLGSALGGVALTSRPKRRRVIGAGAP
ncbi:MAG: hypothetical protein CHACPFDD_01388 [Phycisphaerae bacterium]|nr:hypothetical protein [Phycisphaerae bacterium]